MGFDEQKPLEYFPLHEFNSHLVPLIPYSAIAKQSCKNPVAAYGRGLGGHPPWNTEGTPPPGSGGEEGTSHP